MKSYREISQEYAKEGIRSTLLLNGGAAVTLLTQLKDLAALGSLVPWAMGVWALGTVLGSVTWLLAFAATRHFDEWETKRSADPDLDRQAGNRYQFAGQCTFGASIASFAIGCALLAFAVSG